jgi:hypothetical protein
MYLQVETKEPKGLFVAKNADDIRPGMVDPRIESVEIPKPVLVLAAKLKMKYDLAISALMTRYVGCSPLGSSTFVAESQSTLGTI